MDRRTGELGLVFTAWMKHGKNHQIGIREEPLLRLRAERLRRVHEPPEIFGRYEAAKVFQANTREVCHFIFREDLLAGLDSDHLNLPTELQLPQS